ncbi:hypothetical protein OG21DRAFT_87252 [Imleria badia]|nr:hypothetical protein OG21DRAFT_87252 [Imleria badia]
MSQTPRRNKRARSPGIPCSSPVLHTTPQRRESSSSLPPSSPLAPFSDTDDSVDERDAVRDLEDDEVDGEGEDLFADDMDE